MIENQWKPPQNQKNHKKYQQYQRLQNQENRHYDMRVNTQPSPKQIEYQKLEESPLQPLNPQQVKNNSREKGQQQERGRNEAKLKMLGCKRNIGAYQIKINQNDAGRFEEPIGLIVNGTSRNEKNTLEKTGDRDFLSEDPRLQTNEKRIMIGSRAALKSHVQFVSSHDNFHRCKQRLRVFGSITKPKPQLYLINSSTALIHQEKNVSNLMSLSLTDNLPSHYGNKIKFFGSKKPIKPKIYSNADDNIREMNRHAYQQKIKKIGSRKPIVPYTFLDTNQNKENMAQNITKGIREVNSHIYQQKIKKIGSKKPIVPYTYLQNKQKINVKAEEAQIIKSEAYQQKIKKIGSRKPIIPYTYVPNQNENEKINSKQIGGQDEMNLMKFKKIGSLKGRATAHIYYSNENTFAMQGKIKNFGSIKPMKPKIYSLKQGIQREDKEQKQIQKFKKIGSVKPVKPFIYESSDQKKFLNLERKTEPNHDLRLRQLSPLKQPFKQQYKNRKKEEDKQNQGKITEIPKKQVKIEKQEKEVQKEIEKSDAPHREKRQSKKQYIKIQTISNVDEEKKEQNEKNNEVSKNLKFEDYQYKNKLSEKGDIRQSKLSKSESKNAQISKPQVQIYKQVQIVQVHNKIQSLEQNRIQNNGQQQSKINSKVKENEEIEERKRQNRGQNQEIIQREQGHRETLKIQKISFEYTSLQAPKTNLLQEQQTEKQIKIQQVPSVEDKIKQNIQKTKQQELHQQESPSRTNSQTLLKPKQQKICKNISQEMDQISRLIEDQENILFEQKLPLNVDRNIKQSNQHQMNEQSQKNIENQKVIEDTQNNQQLENIELQQKQQQNENQQNQYQHEEDDEQKHFILNNISEKNEQKVEKLQKLMEGSDQEFDSHEKSSQPMLQKYQQRKYRTSRIHDIILNKNIERLPHIETYSKPAFSEPKHSTRTPVLLPPREQENTFKQSTENGGERIRRQIFKIEKKKKKIISPYLVTQGIKLKKLKFKKKIPSKGENTPMQSQSLEPPIKRKYLKAHSHQFSYLYPSDEQSSGKLGRKIKELNQKLNKKYRIKSNGKTNMKIFQQEEVCV